MKQSTLTSWLGVVLFVVLGLLFVETIAETFDVSIEDNFFDPATITISPGDRIRWTNTGAAEHKSRPVDGYWDSGRLEPGESYTRTFNTLGEFDYYDPLHTQATGTISVVNVGVREDTWSTIKRLYQ